MEARKAAQGNSEDDLLTGAIADKIINRDTGSEVTSKNSPMDHLGRRLLPWIHTGRLERPPGAEDDAFAISVDTLVEGVHFLAPVSPEDLGHKALAVNLSDLAAMGARPEWASLAVALPEDSPSWAERFASGLLSLAERFDLQLAGLKTCRGHLNVTVEVLGSVPAGKALRRSGARAGDLVCVTGTLGDAGVALQALQGKIQLHDRALAGLTHRLHRPQPRVTAGIRMRDIASSAIDVSDGLAADLGHILEASGVGASIDASRLPVSAVVAETLDQAAAWRAALTSGDDYELCFTVPREKEPALTQTCRTLDCPVTIIGRIEASPGIRYQTPDGTALPVATGYQHFA